MKPLILNIKSGFKNLYPQRPVVIRDFRSKLFYSTVGLKPVKNFNLPIGTYYIDTGLIQQLKYPIKYKLNTLPPYERRYKNPFVFNIIFAYNPNKCSILWDKNLIVYDYSLKTTLLPYIYFILYHEFAHYLYVTEKYADLASSNMMLKKGFNPSQCGLASLYSLSETQFERKKFLIHKLVNRNK